MNFTDEERKYLAHLMDNEIAYLETTSSPTSATLHVLQLARGLRDKLSRTNSAPTDGLYNCTGGR